MSLLWVSLKKDLEKAKEEIKGWLADIKNTIQNNQNQSLHVINNISSASKEEIIEKRKEETEELEKIGQWETKLLKTKEQKEKQRTEKIAKIVQIENLVEDYFNKKSREKMKKNIKFENSEWNLILDWVIDNKIIEIKFIWPKSITSLYFILGRFIEKIMKITPYKEGIFIIVSESMDVDMVVQITAEIIKLQSKVWIYRNFNISVLCFKLEKGNLVEIKNEE